MFDQGAIAFHQRDQRLLQAWRIFRVNFADPGGQVFLAGAVGQTERFAKIIGDHQFGTFQVPVPQAVALPFQGKTPAFLAGFQAFKQGPFFGDVAHRHQGLRSVIVFLAGELNVGQKTAAIETPVPLGREKTLSRQVITGRLLVVIEQSANVLLHQIRHFAGVAFKCRRVGLDDDAAAIE